MKLNVYLARKIGSKVDSTGRLSRMGSVISVVSVAVSMAVIIISVAVSNGFRSEIRGKARGFAADVVLTAPGSDIITGTVPVRREISYMDRVKGLGFVETVNPVSYRYGIVKKDGEIEGILLKGVDSLYNMDFYRKYLCAGEVPAFTGRRMSNDILLSRRLADLLGYRVGDKVLAYFVDGQVRVRNFRLAGIFDAQLEQLDKVLAVADIRQVNRLNGWKEEVSGFELFFKDRSVSAAGNASLEQRRDAIDEVIFEHQQESDSSLLVSTLKDRFYILFDWLHLLDINVMVILALMIAVAGFNMVSGLLIMLFERTGQIGLFKALGMTDRAIAGVFMTKAAGTVLQGMAYGNAIALAFCFLQDRFHLIALDPVNYFVSHVPIDLNLWGILLMNGIAFALILAILLIPCRFISRIDPAAIMRVK